MRPAGRLVGSEINAAKIILPMRSPRCCMGAKPPPAAEATAREVFEQGGAGGDLEVATIGGDALPMAIVQLLTQTGITRPGKEAKRPIAEGGLRLNNDLVSDPQLCRMRG